MNILHCVGLVSVEYLRIGDIASFEMFKHQLGGFWMGNILLVQDAGWKRLTEVFLEADRRVWKETNVSTPTQGNAYENRVTDVVTYFNPVELEKMERDRFLLRVEDVNGRKWLIGQQNFPLHFKADYSSQSALYECAFFGKISSRTLQWQF